MRYVDRGGELEAYDFTSFTKDGAAHNLDLSSIIPKNAKKVDIWVAVAQVVPGGAFWFDKISVDMTYRHYGNRTHVANYGLEGNYSIPVVNQAISYYFDAQSYTTTRLTVLGWWI